MQAPAPEAALEVQQAATEERSTVVASAPAEPVIESTAAELPVPVPAPEVSQLPEPAIHAETIPALARPHSEPTAQPAAAPDVEKALEESGLVMIQTDPNKAKRVAPALEPQYVAPAPRPRRAPPPDTGPLQIVETHKNV